MERTSNNAYQSLFIEIQFSGKRNVICGVVYRQHNYLNDIDLIKSQTCSYSETFLLSLQSWYLFPTIDKPTRVYNNSLTLIDNILINNPIPGQEFVAVIW